MEVALASKHVVASCRQGVKRSVPSRQCVEYMRRLSTSTSQLQGERSCATKSQSISAILSKPTWSVRSLLPGKSSLDGERVTPKQLHHRLRLSALPLPMSSEEEARMVEVLQSQLHFVKDIQAVDTAGLTPVRSIRDETEEGTREATIGVGQLSEVLAQENVVGHSKRPRRQRTSEAI